MFLSNHILFYKLQIIYDDINWIPWSVSSLFLEVLKPIKSVENIEKHQVKTDEKPKMTLKNVKIIFLKSGTLLIYFK